MPAKLSDLQRSEIHGLLRSNTRPIDIQKQYGVSKQTIFNLKKSLNNEPTEDKNIDPKEKLESMLTKMYDPVNMIDHIESEAQAEEKEKHMTIPKSLITQAQTS